MEGVIGTVQVEVHPRPVASLAPVIGPRRLERLLSTAAAFQARAAGRSIWNVNSTAVGGGVAEMLRVLCGYVRDLDIDIRWVTIGGPPDFFALTKRLHNLIHGQPDPGPLGRAEAERLSDRAREVAAAGGATSAEGRAALAAFDAELRDARNTRNPGTTADLTCAALFVVILEGGWNR